MKLKQRIKRLVKMDRGTKKSQGAVVATGQKQGTVEQKKIVIHISDRRTNGLTPDNRKNINLMETYANKVYDFPTDIKKLTSHMLPIVAAVSEASIIFSLSFGAYQKTGGKISRKQMEHFKDAAFLAYKAHQLETTFKNFENDVKNGIATPQLVFTDIVKTFKDYSTFTLWNLHHARILKRLGLKQIDYTKLTIQDKADLDSALEDD